MAIPVEIADDASALLARHGHPNAQVFDVDSERSPMVIAFVQGDAPRTAEVTVTKGKTTVEVEDGWSVA